MGRLRVGDVERVKTIVGTSTVRRSCPTCRCYLRKGASECSLCGSRFIPVTDDYVEMISVGRR